MTSPVTPDAPLYYAKGLEVWKSPVGTKVEGGTSFTLGFHACTASEVIGEEGAVAIAALLCLGEQAQSPSANPQPVAWGEVYDDKIVTVSLDKSKWHTTPLYLHPPAEPNPQPWDKLK